MPAPEVFISTTSADLASTRQVVKEALLTIGCYPIEQTNFSPDWRDVLNMLRDRITDCQAVIHIVGLRYGAEPDPATLPAGVPRRSYTQMEYDFGRALQRKRGDKRFRVYTFVCSDDFPYDAASSPESDEKQELQKKYREGLLEGAALYETPRDKDAVEKRVLALREEVIKLRGAENRRTQLTLTGIVLIILILVGMGYLQYQSYEDLPSETAREVTQQLDAELVATRLRKEIESRFETEATAARVVGKNWKMIRELERRRDAALDRVDEVIRTIKEGLAADPSPIFTEGSRILADKDQGVTSAIAYLESHKADSVARAERAAAQMEAAEETVRRELRPLLLQAGLHETRLEWDKAFALLQKVAGTAPQWFDAQLRLGEVLYMLARYGRAEPHMRAAVALAGNPKEEALALNNLASLLQATNRLAEAEPLYRSALAIDEVTYGPAHPIVGVRLNNLASLLQATNRLAEAEPLYRRALAIDEASYGPDHPDVAIDLNNLASLLRATNRLAEAEPLMRRVIEIFEASSGPEHPSVAVPLNNLAGLLQDADRPDEAEPLYRRALSIIEASYGPEHPNVASVLNNLASLLQTTERLEEAELLMSRALEIFLLSKMRTGHEHPHVRTTIGNYARLLTEIGFEEAEQRAKIESLIDSVQNRVAD